jgi:hypothetical protein
MLILPGVKSIRPLSGCTIVLGMFVFAVVVSLPFQPAFSTTLEFDHTVIDPSPPSGSSCCLDVCAVGDIDGDGIDDVMVGSENSVGVVWYHAPDWTRYTIGAGSFTTDGEVADVDADGDLDVVISCISRSQIEWWENLGNPFSSSGWSRHTIGSNFSHDVAIGDINDDGDLDVVVFRKGTEILWFEAPPDPVNGWTRRTVSSSSGEGLDVGDIDGDGDLDIAGSQNWYENTNGSGTSWSKHAISGSWGSDCRDIIADMDGDDDNDIVLSHSEGSGQIAWFENPGWAKHAIDASTITQAHSLEVADFDHDGDLDVMSGQMHTSSEDRVMVYENLGGGTSYVRTILATTGTHNARLGDINGDGKQDIVGKNYDGPKQVEAWVNTTHSAVTIAAFGAWPADDGVLLEWSISQSDGLSGFDVYRSVGEGQFALVNSAKIPPEADSFVDETVEAGRIYNYRLAAYDRDGTFYSRTVSVSVPVPAISLDPSYPNPFRESTMVGFRLSRRTQVRLTVHDVAGRLVAVLADEPMEDGYREVEWNGRNYDGRRVRSGVYFLRLDTGGRVLVQKLVVVR